MEVNQLEKNTQKYKIGSTDEHTNKYGHQHWFRISFVGNLYGIFVWGATQKRVLEKLHEKYIWMPLPDIIYYPNEPTHFDTTQFPRRYKGTLKFRPNLELYTREATPI